MPKRPSHQEVEIKLSVHDLAAIRARLKRLRAQETVPRTYEMNTLYDTADQSLRRAGRLIRVRTERPARYGTAKPSGGHGPAVLTYKGPSNKSIGPSAPAPRKSPARARGRFKIKTELEVAVSETEAMVGILAALGLRPSFRYEKFRTTYALPSVPRLQLELDETPVGTYLELEGAPQAIDRAARLLGYLPSDYSTATYGSLYLADCRRRGAKPGDMLFPSTQRTKKSR